MKAIVLCALVAVATSQFASSPAEVILQRQGDRAILTVPENFQFGQFGNSFQGQGLSGGFGGQSAFQRSQRRNPFQQGAAVRSQQQQKLQQGAAVRSQQQQKQQQQQSQSFQLRQNKFQNQQIQRAPVQPSTILAGGPPQGFQLRGAKQQQQEQQQQQQQFKGNVIIDNRQFREQQPLRTEVQQQESQEVQGVFEPLNLPSGASLLLGQVSTQFSCNNLPYGYYGDEANRCLVFHICYPARFSNGVIETYQYSFMCGEGTQFDQNKLVCVSKETALPCGETKNYYFRNAEFGLPHEKSALKSGETQNFDFRNAAFGLPHEKSALKSGETPNFYFRNAEFGLPHEKSALKSII